MRRALAGLVLVGVLAGGGFTGGAAWERHREWSRAVCHFAGGQEDSYVTDCDFRHGAFYRGAPNR